MAVEPTKMKPVHSGTLTV